MIWWTERYKIAVVLFVFAVGLLLMHACVNRAHAHDPKRPELDKWFMGLSSPAAGLCCNKQESRELDDSDWDTKDANYRVRLDGVWYDVPDRAVVKEKNLVGRALIWVSPNYGRPPAFIIRCFLPGTWS